MSVNTNSVPEPSLAARQPPVASTCSVRSSEPPQSLLMLAVTVRLPVVAICWHTVIMSAEGTAPHSKAGMPLARSDDAIWVPTIPMNVLGALALPVVDGVVAEMVSWAQELLPSFKRRSIRKRTELISLMAVAGLARGVVQLVGVEDDLFIGDDHKGHVAEPSRTLSLIVVSVGILKEGSNTLSC